MKQQPPEQKNWKRQFGHFFEKPFWTKTPENNEHSAHPSANLVQKNPLKPLFLLSEMMWTTYWPNNVDHLLTLKPPKCGPLIDPTAYIYIYIYIYMAKASLWTYLLCVFAMNHCCQKFGLIRFQCSTIHCYWRLDWTTFWIEPQALLHDFSNDVSQEKPASLEGHTQNPNCAVFVCRVGVENRVEDWGLGFWPKVKLREDYPLGWEFKVTVEAQSSGY